jgi:NTP pyrophosphatase (non-canonical NTP hydrolase)
MMEREKPMRPMNTIALDWACRSFGSDHVYNFPVRALRCAEEAVELAQAYNISKEKMLELVEIVYSRPPGKPEQELGGVALTATVLAAAHGHDLESFLEVELRRVLAKPSEHFAKRNQDKIDMGLTA